jgi:large repetitive protein
MTMMQRFRWSMLALLLAMCAQLPAAVAYVDAAASGANNGTSWANARTSLVTALAAAVSGDEIWIRAGTYKPTALRTSSFQLKSGVNVYGGFAGTETSRGERDWRRNQTILSGDIGTVGIYTDDTYHVVLSPVSGTAVLDGCVVRDGYAEGSSPNYFGGGVYAASGNGTVTLRNCTFLNNKASAFTGGAVAVYQAGCVIEQCIFQGNTALYGGAVYATATTTIKSCVFVGNTAGSLGNALYNSGGMSLVNCTVQGNNNGSIGAIYGAASIPMSNCIVWGNTVQLAGSGTASYCVVEGGVSPWGDGGNNSSVNPAFINTGDPDGADNLWATADDGLIATGASMANNGTTTGIPAADVRGAPRNQGAAPERGAYEKRETALFVKKGATGSGNGDSWANAVPELREALASSDGQNVWIAAGTYKPTAGTDRTVSFALGSNSKLYGGFSGSESALSERDWTTNQTVLSGEIGAGGSSDNSYNVIQASGATGVVLDSLVVRDANGNSNGGGISFSSTTATLANCLITANTASHGGGLYSLSGNLTVDSCVFLQNTTPGLGGGVRMYNGAGGVFTNCVFQGNTAAFSASYAGGGVFMESHTANATKFVNCTFQGNAATGSTAGGAVVTYNSGNPAFTNCVFWGNTAGVAGSTNILHASSGTSVATNCDFQLGLPVGTSNGGGNVSGDPQFVNTGDPDGADNQWGTADDGLVPGSAGAAISTGTSTGAPATDIRGVPRGQGYDIGAYERRTRIYVNKSASGANTGISWTDAYTELRTALASASGVSSGDEIWVAAGTYTPTATTTTSIAFTIPTGVKVYGGFAGSETLLAQRNWRTNPTILSGDLGGGTKSMNVIRASSATGLVLDGFTVRNGAGSSGGGLNLSSVTGTIANCVITANAGANGGGIESGSGNLTIDSCVFSLNTATGIGGGLHLFGGAGAVFSNCIFQGNTASFSSAYAGGGVFLESLTSGATKFNNCTFQGNVATGGNAGGAVVAWNSTNVGYNNCIFWGNTAGVAGTANIQNTNGGTGTAIRCDIQGGLPSGTTNGGGNLNSDPGFANTADPDGADNVWGTADDGLVPAATSATLNAGYASGFPATDIRQLARVGLADMGAYERAGRLYVRQAASGAKDGSSWTDAYTEMRDACTALNSGVPVSGAEVWVATGAYKPTSGTVDRNATFGIPAGVGVYGGFAGGETLLSQRAPATNQATLTGAIGGAGNSYRVVTINGAGCTLDGFTVSDGNGGSGGAGIYGSFSGSFTLASCVVRNNSGVYWGGGISLTGCVLTMRDCQILDNTGSGYGGGMLYQGATGAPTIDRCVFRGNFASGGNGGGGIFLYNGVAVQVRHCLFTGNIASGNSSFGGGGAFNHTSPSSYINCTFQGNSVSYSGGYGGGINNANGTVTMANCIFWGNSASNGAQAYGGGTAVSCDFQGGLQAGISDGGGNIAADPLFANAGDPVGPDGVWATWDDGLFPTGASPARDVGNLGYGTSQQDLRGVWRYSGSGIDLGCYERRVWYFNESAGGNESGGTWDDAFANDLPSVWADTVQPGDELWVRSGTFTPTSLSDRTASFTMVAGCAYYGGFSGTETALSQRNIPGNPTVLSGDIGPTFGPTNMTDNSYHVVVGASKAILDGFIVQAGEATGSSPYNVGGGIYCSGASPTIRNCLVTANRAGFDGPGIYCTGGASPTIDRTAIVGNLSSTGGVYGGGLCAYSSNPVLTNCLISGNQASGVGGAMFLNASNAQFWNCTIVGNTAASSGSAMYASGSSPVFTNSILWGNAGTAITLSTSTPSWEGCDVEGGVTGFGNDDGGNLNSDPLFLTQGDPDGADNVYMTVDDGLRLATGSPCLNPGSPSDAPDGDLIGGTRPHGGVDDNGCYEGETPRVQFALSSSSGAEGTTTVNLNVTLSIATTQTVTVDYAVSAGTATVTSDYTLGTQVVFSPGQTSKNIVLTVVNDQVCENDEEVAVSLTSAVNARISTNPSFPSTHTYTILNDDTRGVTVSAISGNTTEAGGTATFSLVLTSQPTANVRIPLSSSNTGEGTVGSALVTFTSANWSTAQVITVTGVNDFVDEVTDPMPYSIITGACSSSDPFYTGLAVADVSCANVDDDTAGVTVGGITGHTTEAGGTATFTVRLNSQPTATVSIPISSDDTTEGTISPATLTFDAGNWSVNQTVTVTGVDDAMADGAITYSAVLGAASSTDARYGGFNPSDVSVVNDDNDTAGFTTTPAGTVTVTEAGGTGTVTVKLNSQPTANVVVPVSSSNTAEGTVSPTSLTFTTANWNTAQSITVTGVNDDVDDGDSSWLVVLGADTTTTDTSYKNLNPADVAAATTDDDTKGFTITPTSGLTTTESAGTASFTVRLNSRPTATVTLGLSSSNTAEGTVSPATLTFLTTGSSWSTPQTVTVTGVNDAIVDGSVAYSVVTAAATGGDYAGINPTDVSVTNSDNDVGSVTITQSGGTTAVSEAGGTDTYTIVLGLQPSAMVTVTASPDAQMTAAPATIYFGPAASGDSSGSSAANLRLWSNAATVTVGAVNDNVDEGVHSGMVGHSASGGGYTGVSISSVTATITDNDTAAVTVGAAGTAVEGGATATYTLVLATQPTASVTVALSPDSQVTTSPPSVTFTTANWSTTQTITVTAVDDTVAEGAHSGTITHSSSSSDPKYNGLSIGSRVVSITDNDVPGVTLGALTGGIAEGGATATYTVRLNTQPTASVVVTPTPNAQCTVSPTTLTFTTGNWNTNQTITVSAVDDVVSEGTHSGTITHATTSSDPNYAIGIAGTRTPTITDNDSAGYTITPGATLIVTEAGTTGTVTVRLNTQPTADVSIAVSSSNTAEGTVSPASLTFTSVNWATPQSVTVTGVNDDVDDGDSSWSVVLGQPSGSADATYAALNPADVSASTSDDDTKGFTITPTSGLTTTEAGGTATFTVRLNSRPTATVTLGLSSSNTAEGTVSPASLTFLTTGSSWSTEQTVTVTGVNDAIVDGAQAYSVVTAAAAGGDYAGLNPSDVTVSNSDDDVGTVTVTQSGGTTVVSEAGTTDTYTLVLGQQPSAMVTVTATPDAQVTATPATVYFGPAATGDFSGSSAANLRLWSNAATVTVAAVDDTAVEGAHSGTITHGASGGGYTGVSIASVTASITDNDSAAVTVGAMSGTTTEAAGGQKTYTLVLSSLPAANVVVTITPDIQETVSPSTVYFGAAASGDSSGSSAANLRLWSNPATVTVTAVDDAVAETSPHTGLVSHSVSSSDPNYNGLSVSQRSVQITDNDTAGIDFTAVSGTIAEGGATATYTVVLHTKPTAAVTVTPTPDAQITVLPASLSFTTGNWNTPQTITVTAVDDLIDEDDGHAGVITHAATSSDTFYAIPTAGSRSASINDNDTAGYTISTAGPLSLTEAAGGSHAATFTVRLNTKPTANVTLGVASSNTGEGTVSPASLAFTSVNWATPQTVTVTAVDDSVDDGDVAWTAQLNADTGTGDLKYLNFDPADVSCSTTDDDTRGVVVLVTDDQTSEGGGTATFSVHLASQPTATVTFALQSSDSSEGLVSLVDGGASGPEPVTLTFLTTDWNNDQVITIAGQNDALADGNIAYTMQLQVCAGGDYAGFDPPDVALVNVDDDTQTVSVSPSNMSVTEGAAAATVTITLGGGTDPGQSVFVPVVVSTPSQAVVSTGLVVIPSGAGRTGTFTVQAVDDAIDDGDQALTVTVGKTVSADAGWNDKPAAALSVAVTAVDDDSAGFTVSPTSGLSVSEGLTSAVFTVRLNSQPTSNVLVDLARSDTSEGTLSASQLTFTPGNWNVSQVVTVTGADDDLDDGDIDWTVLLTVNNAGTADVLYKALDPADVAVTTTDNDAAAVIVTQSGGTTLVTEGGATDTYTVVLACQPTASVTVAVTPDSHLSVAPTSLTFTTTDWFTAQTVTVSAVDDGITEGSHSGTINHTASGGGYGGLSVASVTAGITDNDPAGVTVSALSGGVTEGGASATYTVALITIPTGDVTVTVTPDAQLSASPTSLIFTSSNWNVAQTVTVSAVNDAVAEGTHVGSLAHSASGGGYTGVSITGRSATITDDDTAGVSLTQSGGTTQVTEGGATDSYSVVLTSQPTANVVVTVSGDAQAGAAPGTLTFTSGNWNVAQTVTVTAVNDAVVEGAGTATVSHSVASSDSSYNLIAVSTVTATVTDNEAATVTVTQSGGSTVVAEGGASDTYTVVLAGGVPSGEVVVSATGDAQVSVSPAAIHFGPAATGDLSGSSAANLRLWSNAATFSVTAIDDNVAEGAHSGSVSHSVSGGGYGGSSAASVAATVNDNDSAGYSITPSSLSVGEAGGTGSFTVSLTSQPTANVTIGVSSNDLSEGTVSPATLTFTSVNWNLPQAVTVTGVVDAVADGNILWSAVLAADAATSDTAYLNLDPADVTATTLDDDTASVVLTQSSGSTLVAEGGATDAYTVVLTSQPTSDVTVTVAPDAQLSVSPSSLTFTSSNWFTTQSVTVTAVNDLITEGAHTGTINHTASGGGYGGLSVASVTAAIIDDDTPGVMVSALGGVVAEGGASTSYTLVLNTIPTGDVTITVTPDAQLSASPASLTFTSSNWNVPQTVTVTAVNDAVAEGTHVGSLSHSASGGGYTGVSITGLSATITDNDSAGVTVTQTGGTTVVVEGGASDTYTVVLTSQPTANVVVTVTGDAQAGVSPGTLTFTSGNWSVAQTVTVTAVDDAVVEGSDTAVASHSVASADGAYNLITVTPVSVSVVDDEVAVVTVVQSGGTTAVTEGGASDSYTVVLAGGSPTGEVVVSAAGDAQVSVSPAAIHFGPAATGDSSGSSSANLRLWSSAATFTVTAIDDGVAEGPHSGTLAHTVTGGGFAGATAASVTAGITDNDSAGVVVTPTSGLTCTEAGGQASFTVLLTSQPTAQVDIAITGSDASEGLVAFVDGVPCADPVTISFMPATWSTPRTITLVGVDDLIDDGDVDWGVDLAAAVSADPRYSGLAVPNVVVRTSDNDAAAVTVDSSAIVQVDEAGSTSTSYSIALATQPTGDVRIGITPPSGQLTADKPEVWFGPTTLLDGSGIDAAHRRLWSAPATITLTAVDDTVDEAAIHSVSVTHSAAGNEFTGVAIASVTIDIADNDSAAVTVSPLAGLVVSEAGGSDTFTVQLGTKPTADVIITYTSSDPGEGLPTPATLSFSGANWNVPQTVTVTGVDDQIDDGAQGFTITAAAASADANYQGIPVSSVSVSNSDNDTAGVLATAPVGTSSESGGSTTFTVVLTAQPLVPVTLRLQSASTGEGLVSAVNGVGVADPADLVFTAANWNVPRTITVTGVDDHVIDGTVVWQVTGAFVGTDGGAYGPATPVSSVAVSNQDNDSAGIVLSTIDGFTQVAEGGAGDTYNVVLTSQPVADVTVNISPDSQVTTSSPSLVFTSGNWNVEQTITVSAVDDAVAEGQHNATITHSLASADTDFNGASAPSLTVSVTDNDTAGVQVNPISGHTDEAGGTATFAVVLTSQPTANVVIALSSSDVTEGTVAPVSLTFTAGNWNVAQTVTVTGVDDTVADGNITFSIITSPAVSADSRYNGVDPADVSAVNDDDDSVGVDLAHTGGSTLVTEGGATDSYTVVLHSQPLADVTVTITPDAQVTIDTDSGTSGIQDTLVFTPANWNVPQSVDIVAVNDLVDEGGSHPGVVSHVSASADPAYDGLSISPLTATITDDDSAALVVSAVTGAPTESGGAATFQVSLATMPTSDVSLQVDSSDNTEGLPTVSTLTFTSVNWNVPQTVTVNGVDDLVDDGDIAFTITLDSLGSDARYTALAPVVLNLSNVDDDGAGVVVTPTSVTVTEASGAGHTASFSVRLGSAPLDDVTVAVASDNTAEGTVSAASLTFTPVNWNTPQSVTVTGVDDGVDDGDIAFHIVLSPANSTDGNYNGLDPVDVAATCLDDDGAGFLIAPLSLSTIERGLDATFAISLSSQPTADVTISVASGDLSEGTISTSSLTFTTLNWATPQVVTVTPQGDDVVDGNITWTVVLGMGGSADGAYAVLNPPDVTVVNQDIDAIGVTLTQIGGSTAVSENGATDAYTLQLNTIPSDDVTVTIIHDAQVTTSSASLVFTPVNWNIAQTVTVGAVDDVVSEGAHNSVISHTIGGGGYGSVTVPNVVVSITDNDTAAILVTPVSGLETDEQGGVATFTVALGSQPTSNVTIPIASGNPLQDSVSTISLVFTNLTWSTPQTVTVTGISDDIADGDVVHTILVQPATSSDSAYSGLDGADPQVTNHDDDVVGVDVTPTTGLVVDETGSVAAFTVRLRSRPLADVTIATVSSDPSEGTASPASLTFTALNWSTPQTVTTTGVDDAVLDGNVSFSIVTTAVSSDPAYNGLAVPDVAVTCADDDVPTVLVTQGGGGTSVAENGAGDTITVRLVTTPTPTATVTVTLTESGGALAFSPSTLTFTAGTHDVPQTVTISAVDDLVAQGAHSATVNIAAAGGNYDGVSAVPVVVAIADDDQAGFEVSPLAGLHTGEDGSASTFTVVLTSQPTADVSVAVGSSDAAEGDASPSVLTFTALNWSTPQTVTVTGVDDPDIDGDVSWQAQLAAATSGDAGYNGLDPADVLVTNQDDDSAGVLVFPGSLVTTDAGGTAQFSVVLTARPNQPVTVPVVSGDPGEVAVFPASLVFTSANWNNAAAHTVTCTGGGGGGSTVTIDLQAAVSADADFNGIDPSDVTVVNQDTDTPAVVVELSGGPLTLSEGGGSRTYSVRLSIAPTQPVTVDLTGNGQVSFAPASLTFGIGDLASQTVTVTAIDDAVAEGDHLGSIAHLATSADAQYSGLSGPTLESTLHDNDVAGVVIDTDPSTPGVADAGTLVVSETGGTASFSVRLLSAPVSPVTLLYTASDATQAGFSPASVVLDGSNWNVAQTVTVTGLKDTNDGDAAFVVQLAFSTLDSGYTLIDPTDLPAINRGVNNPPTVDAFAPLVLLEDAAQQTVVATGIGPGQTGEAQVVSVIAVSSNTALIPDPSVSYSDPSAVATLTFTPVPEASGGPVTIDVTVNDDAGGSTTRSFTVTVTAVNDVPELGTNTGLGVLFADPKTPIDTGKLSATDIDSPVDLIYRLLLAPNKGRLLLNVAGTDVELGNNGVFHQSDLIANNLTYLHDGQVAGGDGFAFTVSDGSAVSEAKVFNITITGLSPPVVTITNNVSLPSAMRLLSYTENDPPLRLDSAATVFDVDSPHLNGGYLRISFATNGSSGDVLALVSPQITFGAPDVTGTRTFDYLGVPIGTVSGGTGSTPLLISFTSNNATDDIATALLQNIYYSSSSEDPSPLRRTVRISAKDESGGAGVSADRDIFIDVVPVDDPPLASAPWFATVVDLPISRAVSAPDPEGTTVIYELCDETGVSLGVAQTGFTLGTVNLDTATGGFLFTPASGIASQDGVFHVNAIDANGTGLKTRIDVQLHVTGADESGSPRILSNAPMRGFDYNDLHYQVQTQAANPGSLTWRLINPPAVVTPPTIDSSGSLFWAIDPLGGPDYLYYEFDILVEDTTAHRASIQPVMIKVIATPAGNG